MMQVSVPGKQPRSKTKAFTRRQLHKAAIARRQEAKQEQREARARSIIPPRVYRRGGLFVGCDPERTLALLGEDA